MNPTRFGKYVLENLLEGEATSRLFLATRDAEEGGGSADRRVVLEQRVERLRPRKSAPSGAGSGNDARTAEGGIARKAKTLVALSHSGIARILEVGVVAGVTFVARERTSGATVDEIVAGGGRFTAEQAAYVGAEVARALAYARREKNLVLDVDASGVTIDDDGNVLLTRFDVASESTSSARTLAALLIETLAGSGVSNVIASRAARASVVDIRLLPLDDVIARAASETAGAREEDDLGEALREFLAGIDAADIARALAEKARAARIARVLLPIDDLRPLAAKPNALGALQATPRTLALHPDRASWTSVAPPDKPRTPPSIATPSRGLPSSMPPPPKMPLAMDDPRDSGAVRRRDRLVVIAVLAAIAILIAFLGAPAIRNATTVAHPNPAAFPVQSDASR